MKKSILIVTILSTLLVMVFAGFVLDNCIPKYHAGYWYNAANTEEISLSRTHLNTIFQFPYYTLNNQSGIVYYDNPGFCGLNK